LNEDADYKEISDAYILLKRLYSDKENMITISIEEEFLDSNRENILEEIDIAYEFLTKIKPVEIQPDTNKIKKNIGVMSDTIDTLNGKTIKNIRERNNIDLEEIALATNIKKQYLKDIEEESFEELPPRVFLKGYLKELANYLNFKESLINDYLKKYDEWAENN
jgi:DNA-binding transcriptional regulator YiaG